MQRKDDPLLESLVAVAVERPVATGPQVLERLAAGTLAASELAALEREAADSPELAAAMEAHRPLSDARRSAMADAVTARLAHKRPAVALVPAVSQVAEKATVLPVRAETGVESDLDRARSQRARTVSRRQALWATAPVLAAAAGFTLWWRAAPALPPFTLEVTGGQSATRGDEPSAAAVLDVRAEAYVTVVARPAEKVTGPIAARAFYNHAGKWNELPMHRPASASGVVTWQGRARDLFGSARGSFPIEIVVGAPDVVAAAAPGASAPRGSSRLTGQLSIRE